MSNDSIDFERRFLEALLDLGLSKEAAAVEELENEEDTSTDDNDAVTALEDSVTTKDETLSSDPEEDKVVTVTAPVTPTKSLTSRSLFQHPDTHPIVLDLLLLRKYGPEWMEWEAEILERRIEQDFNTTLSDSNAHKIQAVKTLHFIDTYWGSWEVFVWVTMALNGVPPDFHIMQVPTVSQAMISVDIANRVRQDVQFSQELNDFLEVVHMHDGILVPIEPLTFVTMDEVHLYPVDVEDVKKRWPDVRASGKAPPPSSVENEQLRRMLDLRGFLEENRAALREQLQLVKYA